MTAKHGAYQRLRQRVVARENLLLRGGAARELAARQRRGGCPGPFHLRKVRRQLFQRLLSQPAVRGDLAAEDGKHRWRALRVVQAQRVVASDRRRVGAAVVVEWPDAGVAPANLRRIDCARQVAAGSSAEIMHLFVGWLGRLLVVHRHVGGADEGEAIFEGDDEDDAPVVVLHDEGVLALVEPGQHDVAAFHEPHRIAARLPQALVQHVLYPRPGGVDHSAGADLLAIGKARAPKRAVAPRAHAFGTHHDPGAAPSRVERIGHHQARVVDAAVGIDETVFQAGLQACGIGWRVEPHHLRCRQHRAAREVIVEKKTDADHPARTQLRHVRHHEVQRPGKVGGNAQQDLALRQRFGHQAKLELLEVAQAAVDQLGRGRRSRAGKVAALDQQRRQAAAGGVARDAGAVDAAANDEEIVDHRAAHYN